MTDLMTPWGEMLDPEAVLSEYPRPQLVRDSYLNLNGHWEYAFTAADSDEPDHYDGHIVVPFSPEAALSGVNRQLQPNEKLWYRRTLQLPSGFDRGRVLLHFGAVDQSCEVYCNGMKVGDHQGGYWAFTCDLTGTLSAGDNIVTIAVRDVSDSSIHATGKQRLDRGGIWYTAQSGIWQTVWVESVPIAHIHEVAYVPRLDRDSVEVTVHASDSSLRANVTVHDGDEIVATAHLDPGRGTEIPIPDPHLWSPEDPHLYRVTVTLGDDVVRGYFGMRSFGVGTDDSGHPRLLLNGRPYFHAGVLDQGYWPDGLYTAPSDEAMIHDIATMKELGYTMLRKHIKVEPMRWYYHCDRLGMLVWQDLVNGGGPADRQVTRPPEAGAHLDDTDLARFGRGEQAGRDEYRVQLRETVRQLHNVVALAVWVPFNEGWGQFCANEITRELSALDPTRPIDQASGWHDQGGGDFRSIHVYIDPFVVPDDTDDRVLALTEFGGYSLQVAGHHYGEEVFGYRGYESAEELAEAFDVLHRQQILPAVANGLSATVYTQLADVEDELNGLLTYDRRVVKIPASTVLQLNRRLQL